MGIRREEENGECLLIRLKSSFWSKKKMIKLNVVSL